MPLALGDRHAVRTSSSSSSEAARGSERVRAPEREDADLNAGADLSVSRVQASDEGRYVCRANSAFGRASASVAIFVQSERSHSQRALCFTALCRTKQFQCAVPCLGQTANTCLLYCLCLCQ